MGFCRHGAPLVTMALSGGRRGNGILGWRIVWCLTPSQGWPSAGAEGQNPGSPAPLPACNGEYYQLASSRHCGSCPLWGVSGGQALGMETKSQRPAPPVPSWGRALPVHVQASSIPAGLCGPIPHQQSSCIIATVPNGFARDPGK